MKRISLTLLIVLAVACNAAFAGRLDKLLGDADITAAADAGDSDAQHELGMDLIEEAKDAKSIARGIAYVEKAAIQGNVHAMHNFGYLIRRGMVPSKKAADAFKWYSKAAEAGFAGSQNNLGDMYENGEGVAQSYGDAIHWYTRSAMQGEPTAYWSLGECYAKGRGVNQDDVQAYRWLLLAVKSFKNAPENRAKAEITMKKIEKSLSPEKLAEGIKMADRFVPLRQTDSTISDPSQ